MARIRTIKPEFWTDESIIECSLNARLLFIGMWNFADDEGNIEGSIKSIKARIFPADNIEIEPLLAELMNQNLIILYNVDNKNYFHIRGFKTHQRINRPSDPRCPLFDNSVNDHGTFSDHSSPEGKGKEGKGKDKNIKSGKPDSTPSESKPTQEPPKTKSAAQTSPKPPVFEKERLHDEFDIRWKRYRGEKDSRKRAMGHWNASVKTEKDLADYDKAERNYYAIVESDRGSGFAKRRYKNGKTWFNNWRDYVDQKPAPTGNSPPEETEEQKAERRKRIDKAFEEKTKRLETEN